MSTPCFADGNSDHKPVDANICLIAAFKSCRLTLATTSLFDDLQCRYSQDTVGIDFDFPFENHFRCISMPAPISCLLT